MCVKFLNHLPSRNLQELENSCRVTLCIKVLAFYAVNDLLELDLGHLFPTTECHLHNVNDPNVRPPNPQVEIVLHVCQSKLQN